MKNYGVRLLFTMSKYFALGFLCQLLIISLVLADETNAQRTGSIKSVTQVYVKMGFDHARLKDVFSRIESETDFRFTIFENEDYLNSTFTMPNEKLSVEQLLVRISKETGLVFQQINKNIGIKKGSRYELRKNERVEIIAQDRTIMGRVISGEDNSALPGVNVLIKGTSRGTLTDADGNYKLDVPDNTETVLIISFVGYQREEIVIGDKSVVDVTLSPDIKSLQEIVVVGYGTQEKKDITGAVGSVKSEEFNKGIINSPGQLLQGKVSGVQVTSSSGAPGSGQRIIIRGQGSIRQGTGSCL